MLSQSQATPSKLTQDNLQTSKMMSETTSQFSMPMSGISRRSNFTMISLSTQALGAKDRVLPKQAELRAKAVERKRQEQLKEIEQHLRKLRNTDDLSYSANAAEGIHVDDSSGKKLVDEETLQQLIDDCREEEERMSIINEGEETQQQIVRLKNISQMELNKFNNFDFKLAEADHILREANRIYEEASQIANQKSEALELYKELKASNALEKHE